MLLNAEQLSSSKSEARVSLKKGFNLVAAKQAQKPPNTRLSIGGYIADILLDARSNGTIYHWIVQKIGSAEIIQWGQEYAFEDAHSAATAYLESLSHPDKKKA